MDYNISLNHPLGYQLDGVQHLPQKGDKFPTILLVHGFGVDLRDYGLFDDISKHLVSHGYAVIRFSFSGCGKSGGSFIDMTLGKQIEELKLMLSYVFKDRFTNVERVGILAQSFGAATVMAGYPYTGVKSYFFTSPATNPNAQIAKLFRIQFAFKPDEVSQIQRSDKSITKIGPAFWKEIRRYNMVACARKFTDPVCIVSGGDDKLVRTRDAEALYMNFYSRKRIHVIDRADHGFTRGARPLLLPLISDWFNETITDTEDLQKES